MIRFQKSSIFFLMICLMTSAIAVANPPEGTGRSEEESNTRMAALGSHKAIKALTPSLPRHFFNSIILFRLT